MNKFASTLALCYSIVKFLSCFFLSLAPFLYLSDSLAPRLIVGSFFFGSVRLIETDDLCLKFSSNRKTTRCVELTFAPPFWIDSFFSGCILPVLAVAIVVAVFSVHSCLALSLYGLSLSVAASVCLSLQCLLRRSSRICMHFLLACVLVRYREKANKERRRVIALCCCTLHAHIDLYCFSFHCEHILWKPYELSKIRHDDDDNSSE